ncbi:bromodomain testis-specific protein-like [Drosophila rhopaloa]|uniref:Uncharacterized protein n=1 Tax=Drosophila rhopaloa TaxID=1041015 RepID=A0ABM5JD78_DRORH|nr:bromodomain testis-specific protein-like [Drosophila rhopaloa]
MKYVSKRQRKRKHFYDSANVLESDDNAQSGKPKRITKKTKVKRSQKNPAQIMATTKNFALTPNHTAAPRRPRKALLPTPLLPPPPPPPPDQSSHSEGGSSSSSSSQESSLAIGNAKDTRQSSGSGDLERESLEPSLIRICSSGQAEANASSLRTSH